MARKDVIIIAVLVNTALLAVLFMMAINSDDDKINDPTEFTQISQMQPTEIPLEPLSQMAVFTPPTGDEGDNALKAFEGETSKSYTEINTANESDEEPVQDLEQDDDLPPKKEEVKPAPVETAETPAKTTKSSAKFTEVTVKRGDSLDKIARANGTTIKAIKEANHLKNDLLNIGQVLKVPAGDKKVLTTATTESAPKKKAAEKPVAKTDDQFYTVKSGDSPWKIAKKFNMNLDELLKLNNLDEQKARNLKAGDKLRIK